MSLKSGDFESFGMNEFAERTRRKIKEKRGRAGLLGENTFRRGRKKDGVNMSRRGAEREGDTECEAGSRL